MQTTSENTVTSREKSVSKFFKNWEDELESAPEKFKLLKNFRPANNLMLKSYPSGALLSNIKKVCKCIEEIHDFQTVSYKHIQGSHQSMFLLVKTTSPAHAKCERILRQTGGYHSEEINDLGNFTVAHIEDDTFLDTADFTFYRVKDTFVI